MAPESESSQSPEDRESGGDGRRESQAAGDQPAGRGDHVVQEGECILSIAESSGFFWQTIWNDAGNSDLRASRSDPRVLLPGDRVSIPARRLGSASGQTETCHRFRRRGMPAKLRLRFLKAGQPRANQRCVVTVDGQIRELETDADGAVEFAVPATASRGTIEVGTGRERTLHALRLSTLHPHDSVRGVQQRLRNLGLLQGPADGVMGPGTRAALRAFQGAQDLNVSGEMDQPTCSKLKEVHGS